MINKQTNNFNIEIGKIDIKDAFSFFEIDSSFTDDILKKFGDFKIKGRKINVEIAGKKSSTRNDGFRRGDRSKRKNGFKRNENSRRNENPRRKRKSDSRY